MQSSAVSYETESQPTMTEREYRPQTLDHDTMQLHELDLSSPAESGESSP
jgi:hypothetical protein